MLQIERLADGAGDSPLDPKLTLVASAGGE